jgi:uncharacterized membrane protein YbhN (UPF0104 family)
MGRRVLALAVLALLIAVLVASAPRLGEVWDTLAGVSVGWALASVAANVLSLVVRGLNWRVLLRSALREREASAADAVSAYGVGQLVNAVLPGRLGEPAKIATYTRHLDDPGRDWAVVAGTVAAHRLLDAVPLSVLTLALVLSVGIPASAAGGLFALLAGTGVLLVVAVLVARRDGEAGGGGRLVRIAAAIRQGLAVLRNPAALALAVSLQALGWAIEVLGAWLCFRAFGIDEGLAAAGLVVVATNAATLLPFWPGNVGVFQVAVALILVPVGVAYAAGLAYGVGLQAIETLATLIVGVPALLREGIGVSALWRLPRGGVAPAEASPAPSGETG